MGIREKSTRFKELYCASIAYIPVLISGMQAGFPAFIIPQLRREMNMDVDQLSWLASLGYFSLILGPLTTMFFINKYGRKTNLRLILLLFAAGWTVILVSNNFVNLIVGLTLCGVASGSSAIIASVYVSEISRARYRGSMLSMVFLVSIIGTSVVYSLEYYLPWRRAVAIIIALSLLGTLFLRTVPESKHWYLLRDRKEEAILSAAWFEDTPVVRKEVDILHLFTKVARIYGNERPDGAAFTLSGVKNLLAKPFLLASAVSVLRCGTGKVLFVVYPVNLFADMHTPFNSFALSIWYGFLNLLCCFANMVIFSVVDKFNRKRFFYWLSAIMVAALSAVLAIETLSDDAFKPLPELRVFCMYVYLILETTGYFCITSIMIVEVIPFHQRGLALSLNFLLTNVVCAVYIKLFPLLEQRFSFGAMCAFFLVNVALVAWVVRRYFPETRGRLFLGADGAVSEALVGGQFDAMLKEDWLRNENVQQFFTANGNLNVDQLDAELLGNVRREWLQKMKEMLIANGVEPTVFMTPAGTGTAPGAAPSTRELVVDNPFDLERMTENGQVWLEGMRSNWNAWSQNELVTAGNQMLKQQQRWLKNVWMRSAPMTMPLMAGHAGRHWLDRGDRAREKLIASKTKMVGSGEKII